MSTDGAKFKNPFTVHDHVQCRPVLSPDNATMAVLFDNMQVFAGSTNDSNALVSKTLTFSISIQHDTGSTLKVPCQLRAGVGLSNNARCELRVSATGGGYYHDFRGEQPEMDWVDYFSLIVPPGTDRMMFTITIIAGLQDGTPSDSALLQLDSLDMTVNPVAEWPKKSHDGDSHPKSGGSREVLRGYLPK